MSDAGAAEPARGLDASRSRSSTRSTADAGDRKTAAAGMLASTTATTTTTTTTTTATAAVKDKACAYCGQLFTSSSLGRHLDQYLFKKKPDGVHDVDEIRRLRSGITRRTARSATSTTTTATAGGSKPSAATGSPEASNEAPLVVPPQQLNPKGAGRGFRVFLNQPSWQATGVINDLPNAPPVSQLRLPARAGTAGAGAAAAVDAPETARALELALREVLAGVHAAVARTASRSSPFDFDVPAQTFPALCLHALPPPPSLFATHPFAAADAFPLDPPSAAHRDPVLRALRARIHRWQADQHRAATPPAASSSSTTTTSSTGNNNAAADVARAAQGHEELVQHHVDLALRHWLARPPHEQRSLWQLELTRAFAREQDQRRQLEQQLARAQQEAQQLRAQVSQLASCQWPREFALFPPNLLPLAADVARELDDRGSALNEPAAARWDFDAVLARWKRVVMHDKTMGRSGVGAYMDPIVERQQAAAATHNLLQRIPTDHHHNTNNNVHSDPHSRRRSPPPRSTPVSPDSAPAPPDLRPALPPPPAPYDPRDPADFRPAKRARTGLPFTHASGDASPPAARLPFPTPAPPLLPPPTSTPATRDASASSTPTTPTAQHLPTFSQRPHGLQPPPNSNSNNNNNSQHHHHRPPHHHHHHLLASDTTRLPQLDHRTPAEREASSAMASMHHDTPTAQLLPPPLQHSQHKPPPYPDSSGPRSLALGLSGFSRHHGGVS
ncbi:hypothetical protein LOZ58_006728 [Ophidiomyces ophidiicola]|nr:hypothetical protein LOZ58_006728 [Ophidiomyces ophidiicola]